MSKFSVMTHDWINTAFPKQLRAPMFTLLNSSGLFSVCMLKGDKDIEYSLYSVLDRRKLIRFWNTNCRNKQKELGGDVH